MIDENNRRPNPRKKISNMGIVGINVGALLIYSLSLRLDRSNGIVLDAFLITFQFIACLIAVFADSVRWGGWLLSAFLVIIIGLSTCAMN
mgnify:FL=1